MIERVGRLIRLLESRSQSFDELIAARDLRETLGWVGRHRLLGFNCSAIRLRIIHALAQAFQATHFIETGSYHGATVISARKCLCLPVWSCEIVRFNYLVARTVTMGLSDVRLVGGDSKDFLAKVVPELMRRENARPLFYLDAHAGLTPWMCPLLDELSLILKLKSFLAVIDDFKVPEKPFIGSKYGDIDLQIDTISGLLRSAGIGRVLFPDYSPDREGGHARAGYVVLYRSSSMDEKLAQAGFPFNLLRAFDLAQTERSIQ